MVTIDVVVFGDAGVGGEAARDVRGELAVCTLLLVLSGVGIGLCNRLSQGQKKDSTMI
jgi:hypothetical protein